MVSYYTYRNILLNPFQAIYFFLPKVGCSSLKAYIANILEMEKDEHFPNKTTIHDRTLYPFPFASELELAHEYADYFKFSFVRNPWSRLFSCYQSKIRPAYFSDKYFTKGLPMTLKFREDLFWGGMTFPEFVNAVCATPDWEADTHFQSQYYQLSQMGALTSLDFIGKLENMEEDFQLIQEHTGLPKMKLDKLNTSHERAYTSHYTPALRAKVAARFAADIDIFEYKFEEEKSASIQFLKDKSIWAPISPRTNEFLISKSRNEESDKVEKVINLLRKGSQTLQSQVEKAQAEYLILEQKQQVANEKRDQVLAEKRELAEQTGLLQKEIARKEKALIQYRDEYAQMKKYGSWKALSSLKWLPEKKDNRTKN